MVRHRPRVRELALLSTCNRLELYAWTEAQSARSRSCPGASWSIAGSGRMKRTRRSCGAGTASHGVDAAAHLLRVAAGLESQVLGDAQIMGQVKRAYREASEAGAVGPALHRLLGLALHTAKRVKHETGLLSGRHSGGREAASRGGASGRGDAAVHRRLRQDRPACGASARQARRGRHRLINRSPPRRGARAELWGRAAPLDRLHRELAQADLAIVATRAPTPPVRASSLRFAATMPAHRSPAAADRPLDAAEYRARGGWAARHHAGRPRPPPVASRGRSGSGDAVRGGDRPRGTCGLLIVGRPRWRAPRSVRSPRRSRPSAVGKWLGCRRGRGGPRGRPDRRQADGSPDDRASGAH